MFKRILSFGAGVQTTAMALLAAKGEIPRPDVVVFADTGDESPETYRHVREFAKVLAGFKMPFMKVRSTRGNIIDDYMKRQTMPYRTSRSCTDNFKIVPIRQMLRTVGGHAKTRHDSAEKPLNDLGFSWDEVTRLSDSDVGWIENAFPLVDQRIDRAGCEAVLAEASIEVPKSGCMCCPFQSEFTLAQAAKEHPERIARAAKMEALARTRPGKHNRTLVSHDQWTIPQIIEGDRKMQMLFKVEDIPMPCKAAGFCRR